MILLQIQPDTCPCLLARARLQRDRVSGQTVLLYPEGMIVPNATGVAILALCDGRHSFIEILEALATIYKTTPAQLKSDVSTYLWRMYQQGVLDISAEEARDE